MDSTYRRQLLFVLPLVLFFLGSRYDGVQAEELDLGASKAPTGGFTLYWENDLFAKTDREYTNGLKLTWSSAMKSGGEVNGHMPSWIYPVFERLPLMRDDSDLRGLSWSVGHSIYTPEDTQRTDYNPNDRAYAGYLYAGMALQAQHDHHLSVWELDVGVVGPMALGEQLQNLAHTVVGSHTAKGWEHQIPNQLTLDLVFENKWRIWERQVGNGFGFGAIAHFAGHIGNLAIYANTGAEVRFGWHLPEDFGSCPIRPGCQMNGISDLEEVGKSVHNPFSIQLFASVDGRWVLHDLFIDAKVDGAEQSLERTPLVADLMMGIAIHYKQLRVSYANVLRTKQFEQQIENQLFGTLTLAYVY